MKRHINWTEIIIIVVTAMSGFITWRLNEQSKLSYENYVRREQRFDALVSCIHGFAEQTDNKEMRDKFIKELDLSWLYCSDEVILQAYKFLESVMKDSRATEEQQQKALGELMLAIRKDLIENKRLNKTNLKPSDFRLLTAL
ncbi:MAG: hypothetical protein WCE90_02685 [Candidatus Zixiibacteriota bacterium]